MLEVWEQRPQDQRLPKTSARSSAWSAHPSSSGSRASYRKTWKASSPSSSVCFGTRGRRAGGACHRRQLALESGVEFEELEVPLSVHTPAVEPEIPETRKLSHWGAVPNGSESCLVPLSGFLELDPAIFHDKRIAGAKEEASPTSPCCGDHPGARRKKI
ncbi:hypothetical protein Taro_017607 [Colocasia esculenta]|uniref:Uncharacterized protein n=1 Tax=Colocasia esculenta TaxID=4460 RepID=A0A843UWL6_COLES|nr:hypothetical protein [Colocasia esculenta]